MNQVVRNNTIAEQYWHFEDAFIGQAGGKAQIKLKRKSLGSVRPVPTESELLSDDGEMEGLQAC